MNRLRNPEKTRAEILDAAFDVVYRNGFRASSVNDILRRTSVTQGAFFHYFPTKNDLGYALVDEVLTEMMLNRWIRPLSAYKNPIKGMIVRFRKLMEALTDEEMSLGCPLNNLTQEMSPVDPVFREKLRATLQTWIDETEWYLKKAKAEGYLRPDVNTKQTATFMVMMEEGAAALVKNLGGRKTYWSLYEVFRDYMQSLEAKK